MGKNKKEGLIYIVIGGQFGSESKGQFCGHIIKEKKINIIVRTGNINAGHTVEYKGKFYKNQIIPVGWINPRAKLILGAGAYIENETLQNEINFIEKAIGKSIKDRLFIDFRCGVHSTQNKKQGHEEQGHERMGFTGKGSSQSIIEKIKRNSSYKLFGQTDYAKKYDGKKFIVTDTVKLLNDAYDKGSSILIEGTQGTLLDLHFGRYPFSTSRQATAPAWLAECGLSPKLNLEIAMVCRTFPIRVAGNSGGMGNEISWIELSRTINYVRLQHGMKPILSENAISTYELRLNELAKFHGLNDSMFHLWKDSEKKKHSEVLVNIHKEAFNSIPENITKELLTFFEVTTVTKKLRRIAEIGYEDLKLSATLNRPDYIVMNFMNYAFPTLSEFSYAETPEKANIERFLAKVERTAKTPVKYINYNPHAVHLIK